MIEAEQWEKFLARKYVGTKRFGLDGGEAMIPALEAVIKYGGAVSACARSSIGMAHRGRLNVLANVMAKPYRVIFPEFAGGSANPEDVGGSGDVKYHLGTSSDREFDGISVHLVAGPQSVSHLEAVDPVVLGKARAQQTHARRSTSASRCCRSCSTATPPSPARASSRNASASRASPATIPAAASTSSSTTRSASPPRPQFARSSPYPSDVAKAVQAPILHVNGDDPEAVTFACKLAIEFRQQFKRDIVIDMWCYRRFGHNEGDEPSFTQPLMYAAIRQHPPVCELYAARLTREGVIDQAWVDEQTPRSPRMLEGEFEAGAILSAQQGRLVRGPLVRARTRRPSRDRAAQRRHRRRARSCSRDRPAS